HAVVASIAGGSVEGNVAVGLLIVGPGGNTGKLSVGKRLVGGRVPDVRRRGIVIVDFLLLLVAVVADIADARNGVVRDFLFKRQVPVLDSTIGMAGIEQSDAESPRQQASVVGVDYGTRGVHSRDILLHAAQAIVRQSVRREGGIADRIGESCAHR